MKTEFLSRSTGLALAGSTFYIIGATLENFYLMAPAWIISMTAALAIILVGLGENHEPEEKSNT